MKLARLCCALRDVRAATLCLAAVIAVPAVSAAESDNLEQLQALLTAQQQRVDSLKAELAGFQQPGDDAARRDLMRAQIREILSDDAFRESLMPTLMQAGYNKGFFIRSSDDKFYLEFHGRLQMRYTYYHTRDRNRYRLPRYERDDYSGFDVKRVRFHVQGHLYDPDLTYFFKMFADSAGGYDFRMLYAWLNYRFTDPFQLRVGMFQLASTRGAFQSSGNMQFVEYPETVAVFDPGEGVGVRLWGRLFDQKLEYFFDVANSFNGRFNTTIQPDARRDLDGNPAIAFRTVWHACGEIPNRDFVSWGDIDHKETPCVDVGFHYLFNEDRGDRRTSRVVFGRDTVLPGGFGVTNTNGLQIQQVGTDVAFKWRGFSAAAEYILRFVDVRQSGSAPFAPLFLLTSEDDSTLQHGGYVQAGYFLPIPGLENKVEVAARVGGIMVETGQSEGTWFYTGALNYYIQGNKVKLQTDITKISEVPLAAGSWLGNANDDALIWRVQLQFAF
jgi:hypothetical protein